MATGTTSGFWDKEALPAVLKHALLDKYLPRFTGKLGNTYGKVVLIDGYAGEGKYATGAPGSALQMATVAAQLATRHSFSVEVYLIEKDKESFERLQQSVAHFSKMKNLELRVLRGDAKDLLEGVVSQVGKNPLFMFLDPCGLGVSLDLLSHLLFDIRPPKGLNAAPTEVLLNFSADAIRRIGGHVTSVKPVKSTLLHFDETVGGEWWQDIYRNSQPKVEAEAEVLSGYISRLAERAAMHTYAIPVRRKTTHKPLYYLVFGTRNTLGAWHFADSVARSDVKWEEILEERNPEGQLTLEGQGLSPSERLEALEKLAVPAIADNLEALVSRLHKIRVGDHPEEVFGDYFGQVREMTVRKAAQLLTREGRALANFVNLPTDRIEVIRLA